MDVATQAPHYEKVIYTPDVGFGRGECESDKEDEREGEERERERDMKIVYCRNSQNFVIFVEVTKIFLHENSLPVLTYTVNIIIIMVHA